MQVPIVVQVVTRDEGLVGRMLSLASSCERESGVSCQVVSSVQLDQGAEALPRVIVVDLDSMTDEALNELLRLREQGLRAWIVVTYQQPSSERLLKAVRMGANDYISNNPTPDEFKGMLARAAEISGDVGTKLPGRLITVFSNKGGVGATMVTINVAASLAARLPGSVVVVDLVLQHGDISVFLDVPTSYTVVNLVQELDRTDPSYLKSVLPKHPSGIYVLPAPYAPDEGELITDGQVSRLLRTLRSTFDAVVVDAGNEFNDHTLTALDASDRLLLVTLPNLPSVRNTKRTLELFDRLYYDASKLVIVVNRHDAQEKLSRDAIEGALGRQVHWTIPNDYATVVRATNQGTAIRMIQAKGRLAANFDQLVAAHVMGRSTGGLPSVRKHATSRGIGAVKALFRRT